MAWKRQPVASQVPNPRNPNLNLAHVGLQVSPIPAMGKKLEVFRSFSQRLIGNDDLNPDEL